MKIYISKSNQANPDDLIMARAKFQKEGTVLEYTGGVYNPERVKEADKIVIIPPAISTFEKGNVDSITIGKGNFSELKSYEKHMQECEQEPVMSLFKDNREYKIIKYAETAERNWQTNFAKLFVVAL